MPIQTESQIVEKIQQILAEQRLETDDLAAIARLIRTSRARKQALPHSLHLNASDKHGALVHLRILVWKSEEWREYRRDCIDNHRRMYASTQRTERAFRVPRMVRSGEIPLLWDLTEFVDARNLPWSFHGPRRLQEHIRRVEAFFRVSDDMARIRLRSVKPRDWDEFLGDVHKWSAWANRVGILTADATQTIQHVAEEFEIEDLPRSKMALTHGDFSPSNIMFPTRGKPWLIDFDHLRMSIPADNIARLLTVSFIEAGWRERVFTKATNHFKDRDRRGLAVAAAWHTMNGWQREFKDYPPIRRIHSLDQLNALFPGTKFHINLQRHLLERVLDEFGN